MQNIYPSSKLEMILSSSNTQPPRKIAKFYKTRDGLKYSSNNRNGT